MKRFFSYGVLALCAVPLSLSIAGCSQNVGVNNDSASSQNPETTTTETTTTQSKTTETTTPAPPESVVQKAAKPARTKGSRISWEPTLDVALAKARASQKPIMIDFFATWCGPCKMLDAEIYPAPAVVAQGKSFVSVKVDVDQQAALAQKYKITGMPTIVFLSATGKEVYRTQGASRDPQWMVDEMKTALSKVAGTPA